MRIVLTLKILEVTSNMIINPVVKKGIYRVQFREKQGEASSDICKIPMFSKAPPIASAVVT